jgi:aminomethyltransferase
MVAFAGWEMPLEYGGIASEHNAVRTAAGVFDVSHMGEIEIAGKDALAAVQQILSNDAGALPPGRAQYSALLTQLGTFVDDVVVYRLRPDHFLLVVNAANVGRDYTWIAEHLGGFGDAVAMDASSRYGLLAVQGPAASSVLQPLTGIDLSALSHYAFAHGEVASVRTTVSRTGYTGEDGFEIFAPPQSAEKIWLALLAAGEAAGIVPCGLGARDTLRLEAALRLYGNDIDETTTAIEAGLGWIVGWEKQDFVGAAALRGQKTSGAARKIAGFELEDPGIARRGHDVYVKGLRAGLVTSGTQTPFLKKSIGLTYLPIEHATPGTEIEIDIRGRLAGARVVQIPFYKRTRRAGDNR